MESDPSVCSFNPSICLSDNNSDRNNDTQTGPSRRVRTPVISNGRTSTDAAVLHVGRFQITTASAAWLTTSSLTKARSPRSPLDCLQGQKQFAHPREGQHHTLVLPQDRVSGSPLSDIPRGIRPLPVPQKGPWIPRVADI